MAPERYEALDDRVDQVQGHAAARVRFQPDPREPGGGGHLEQAKDAHALLLEKIDAPNKIWILTQLDYYVRMWVKHRAPIPLSKPPRPRTYWVRETWMR